MASGEFDRLDVETCIDVIIAPILMLVIWRHSMACCQGNPVDPHQYMAVLLKLLREGLKGTQV